MSASERVIALLLKEWGDMIRLTCLVNLRGGCRQCVFDRCAFTAPEFLSEYGVLIDKDMDQFTRQAIIWAKEFAENAMKNPCDQ